MPVARLISCSGVAEQVLYDTRTGWPSQVLESLNRSVGAHSRRFFHCKVGISNDPERRWREAYRPKGWHKMHVLYESSSHPHVCMLEAMLVARFFQRDDVLKYWYYNAVGGGGGPKPRSGPYYLYLVSASKYARIG